VILRKKPGLKLFRKIAIELKIPFEKFMLMFIRDKFPEGLEYDELFIKVEPIIKSMLDIMIPD
jgi:hypothetical protein